MRKLQADKELNISHDDEGDEDEFNFTPVKSKKKPKGAANPFDLLNIDDEKSDEDSEEDPEDENATEVAEQNVKGEKPTSTELVEKHTSKKKKKKKKKKGKSDAEDRKLINGKDKIDGAKNKEAKNLQGSEKQVKMPGPVATSGQSTSKALDTKALLGVEHRNLNAENEMKKRFGSHVVRAENRQRRAHQRVYQPSSRLVTPKASWPRMGATGISMDLVDVKRGYSLFAFEHSPSYQEVQFLFLDAVESLNPNNISAILNAHPYHVDSLLQLSEICKMGEDYQMAAELIERALYCLERSFHTLFSLTSGYSRLDYRRAENRSYFIALFRQIIFVGQKGCYRTALELCKLLLNLDPDEDPLGVLLMIDFYALQSEQFSFVIRLFEEWEPHRNLSQLPNFAFSVALAYFRSSRQNGGETKKADEMLQTALIMFPSVLSSLMDKCNVVLDSSLIKHPFFSPASANRDPIALKQLEALYIGRTYHAWKDPEVIDWLALNARIVLEKVDAQDPLVDQCKQKRQVRYRGTPRNVYRHIIMSDIKDATASLPLELANVPLLSYDPLPPYDSLSRYTRPPRSVPFDEERSPLSMFFRSLLPSFNSQAPNGQRERFEARLEQPIEGAEGGPRPLRDTELARGVENLIVAMRELLNTLSYRGEPDGEEGEDTGENENAEDEWEDGEENH